MRLGEKVLPGISEPFLPRSLAGIPANTGSLLIPPKWLTLFPPVTELVPRIRQKCPWVIEVSKYVLLADDWEPVVG